MSLQLSAQRHSASIALKAISSRTALPAWAAHQRPLGRREEAARARVLQVAASARRSCTAFPNALPSAQRSFSTSARYQGARQAKAYSDMPIAAQGADGKALPGLGPPPISEATAKAKRKVTKRSKKLVPPVSDEIVEAVGETLETPPIQPGRLLDELGPNGEEWPELAKGVLRNLENFPGCTLLTRVGGFYESYFDQAPPLSILLGIKLAQRTWGGRTVPMAGFPVGQLDKYLKTLVQDHGKLVAVCDEFKKVEKHKATKGVNKGMFNEKVAIDRYVTRVVSPGTLIDERFLDPFSSNWIIAVTASQGEGKSHAGYGLAWVDVSTADFYSSTCPDAESLRDEVARIGPKEAILERGVFDTAVRVQQAVDSAASAPLGDPLEQTDHPLWEVIDRRSVHVSLRDRRTTDDTDKEPDLESRAVTNLTQYLNSRIILDSEGKPVQPLPADAEHQERDDNMLIDANTLAALEIKEGMREGGGVRGSLLSVVRRTVTKGGARLLGQWLTAPSTSLDIITRRQSLVALFVTRPYLREDLRSLLRRSSDISRGLQRITTHRNDEQDLLEVRDFIVLCEKAVEILKRELDDPDIAKDEDGWAPLRVLMGRFRALNALGVRLIESIDEAVIQKRIQSQEALARELEEQVLSDSVRIAAQEDVSKGRKRKSKEADEGEEELKGGEDTDAADARRWNISFDQLVRPTASKELKLITKKYLEERKRARALEARVQERYGENVSLKFKGGQGWVVHFTDAARLRKDGPQPQDEFTPASSGKTTRTFYSPDWTSCGEKLKRLDEDVRRAENVELERLRQDVMSESPALRRNARLIDELDVLLGFAHLAQELDLVRPTLDTSRDFEVEGGRHLGVELGLLEHHRLFQPNDVRLSPTSKLHVISGPNMGGKSTYLRHAALLAILAQCGAFVPAASARLGIVDRVFSRVGARDDVSRDRSTFMVEMSETSEILRRATDRSLVIADEIGRGTTTDVGIAIAFATLHHLYNVNQCRTLFATHLHEIADMLGWDQEKAEADPRFPHVGFFCTDVDEGEDGSIIFSHRLRQGVNRDSHGLKVAKLADMPPLALGIAEATLAWLNDRSSEAPVRDMLQMDLENLDAAIADVELPPSDSD